MKYVIKDSRTPIMDYRNQVLELVRAINEILLNHPDEKVEMDFSGIVVSRSAMDEIFKQFVSDKSPLSSKVRLINTDEDFQMKLKAVNKTQNFRKRKMKFRSENVISNADSENLIPFIERLVA